EKEPEPNHLNLIKDIGTNNLPALFFSFSRRDCQVKAKELAKLGLFPRDSELVQYMNKKLQEVPNEINRLSSTGLLKETLAQGIAFHHAGLLPVIKGIVEDLFGMGKIKVLYTTETFAVGINMPAKTVIFNSLRKYDGYNFRYLNSKEYFQIAGRAGRRGIDIKGTVVSMIYRPTFNYNETKNITTKDVDPIKSQFKLSINTVLNLINLHEPKDIERILRMSFYSYQQFGENYSKVPTKVLLYRYNSIVKMLMKYGYIENETLTVKGHFASQIFADEITIGEIFATDFVEKIDEYQMLILLCALVYEPRIGHEFKEIFKDEKLNSLIQSIRGNAYLSKEKKFEELRFLTTFIYPIYNGKSFFDVLKLSNLLEGDLIRLYSQINDRIGQIRKASTDYKVLNKIGNCRRIVDQALEGIYLV
ncbi:MAG: helicase-related protein, partial [Nanoarchaeota archaeon]